MVKPSGSGRSDSHNDDSARRRKFAQATGMDAAHHTTIGIGRTVNRSKESNSSGLTVRCPHCRNPMELSDEDSDSLHAIVCPGCGSHFSLVDPESALTQGMPTVRKYGHFELIEPLGVGGYGSVWKAHDTELHRAVAIKIPRKNQLEPTEMEKFFREARAAAQLKHPNIVSVHEVGRADDTVYIVSDLIRGVPLDEWLAEQPISPRQSAELCIQLCDAVEHAHQAGVIHRDLKPGNILIDGDGEPHVMDFGLAKREAGEVTMTMEGRILGTPAYMSPEQARGEGHKADRRTDIYSLGVILFQLLTGVLPFRGTTRMMLHQVLHREPRSPRTLNDQVPRDLETIVLKCLQKDPGRRYATAQDLGDDLRRYVRGEPISARPIGRLERAVRWCRRYPLVAGLSAAVLVLCVSVATVATYAAIQISRSRDEQVAAKNNAIKNQVQAQVARNDEATQRRRAELAEAEALATAQLARQEAETAREVSKFLADMFKASTPLENSGYLLGSMTESSAEMTAREILDRGTERVLVELQEHPIVQADLLEAIGSVYLGINAPEAAGPLLDQALAIRRAELPSGHPKIASLLFQQGYEHFVLGEYPQSLQLLRQALEMRRAAFGDDAQIVTETKQVLGTVLVMASRNWVDIDVDEAEVLLRDVVHRLQAESQQQTTEYGFAAIALCGVLNHRRNASLEQAQLLQQATAAFRARPETENIGDALWLAFNARIKSGLGQLDDAANLYAQAMDKIRATLGYDHWSVMWIAPALAEVLATAGQFDRAIAILDDCERGFKSTGRLKHPFYFRFDGGRVLILLRQGKPDEATEIGKRLLSAETNGENAVVNAFYQLARHHHANESRELALQFYHAALEGFREVDPAAEHHTEFYCRILENAAAAEKASHHLQEAKDLLQEAVAVRMKSLGMDSFETAESVPEELAELNARYQQVKLQLAEGSGSSE